jgi:hypothetical protein
LSRRFRSFTGNAALYFGRRFFFADHANEFAHTRAAHFVPAHCVTPITARGAEKGHRF